MDPNQANLLKALTVHLKRVMLEESLNQTQLAKKIGLSQGLISRVLSYDPGRLRSESLVKIAQAIGTPLDALSALGRAPFRPGHILSDGRYEVREVLGEGESCIVMRALDRKLGSYVAVKFQRDDADPETRISFVRAARAAAPLSGHQNIVTILDVGACEHENQWMNYVVYSLQPDGNLSRAVGNLMLEDWLRLAEDVCRGLEFAHDHQIFHRDIKPSNIFRGQDGCAKIGDFGMGRLWSKVPTENSAIPVSSLAYAAPEQLASGSTGPILTDVYQVGAVCYELATGRRPFPQTDPSGLVQAILNDIPARPETIKDGIPASVADLIMQMLEKDPGKRPQGFAELRSQFHHELLERMVRQRSARGDTHPVPQALERIRVSLKDKVMLAVESLVCEPSPVVPLALERPGWYATVLLRPSRTDRSGRVRLGHAFIPIYFAYYDRNTVRAWSDWIRTPGLLSKPIDINKCASGLPIRWYSEAGSWQRNSNNEGLIHYASENDVIRYMILRDVTNARFRSGPNLIQEIYATDKPVPGWENAVGWDLADAEGQKQPMSQEIETEILIPLYHRFNRELRGRPEEILGVVNFEWEEPLSGERQDTICHYLSRRLQDEHQFGLGLFTCDILQYVIEAVEHVQ